MLRWNQVLGSLTAVSLAVVGVSCNERGEMGGPQATRRDAFRGPIPADFRNTTDAAAFGLAAGTEGARLDRALKAFQVSALGGATLTETASDLPQVARCASVTALAGGFVDARSASALQNAPISQLALYDGQSCASVLARAGIAFPSVASALQSQLQGLSSFGLGEDNCTTTTIDDERSDTHAVRYELERRPAASGAYLAAFDVPVFSAGLEGGSNGAQLALSSEVELKARGKERSLYQWAGLASVVDSAAALVTSRRGDSWEEGSARVTRQAALTFSYGDVPRLEETTRTTIDQGTAEPRIVTAKAVAVVGENGIDVSLETQDVGRSGSARFRLVSVDGVAGTSCVVDAQ